MPDISSLRSPTGHILIIDIFGLGVGQVTAYGSAEVLVLFVLHDIFEHDLILASLSISSTRPITFCRNLRLYLSVIFRTSGNKLRKKLLIRIILFTIIQNHRLQDLKLRKEFGTLFVFFCRFRMCYTSFFTCFLDVFVHCYF